VAELLRMPEIAASTTEAVLSRWPVADNEDFRAKDVIATVETEKALVDVEAEADGVLLHRLVAEGTEVAVGAAIAVLGRPGEHVGDLDALLASLGVAPAGPGAGQPGAAESGAAESGAAEPEVRTATPAAPTPPGADAVHEAATATSPAPATATGRRFSSPLARRLAAEAGLALTDLSGTGPDGRIVRRDVEAAIAQRVALEEPDTSSGSPASALLEDPPALLPAAEPEPAPVPSAPSPTTSPGAGWTDAPISRMRRAVATRLTQSVTTAPHFYVRGTARVDRLLALRAELVADGGPRVSVNDLVVKAVAHAHRQVPEMNVVWTGDAVRTFDGVDVAVAVATDRGLLTPVLRGVDRLPVSAVAAATRDLASRAKQGRLQQSELEGGSISVSNLGMYGTEEFSAILNPPHAAILAVGAAVQQPVVQDGQLEVGTVLKVTLSVDHRPVDGATAAQWMKALLALLEQPIRILA